MFLDLVHEILGSLIFWYNFLNFLVKNRCLVFLMTFLKFFQFSVVFEDQYLLRLTLYFLFHYVLEYLVMLIFLKNLLPDWIWDSHIFINNFFKQFFAWEICGINISNCICEFSDKSFLFFAIPDNCLLFVLNILLNDKYINC